MGIDYCNDTERLHLVLLFGGKRDLDVKPLYTYLCPVIIIVCFLSIIFNAILVSISRQSKAVVKSPILLLSLNLALTDLIASLFNGLGILLNSYLPEVYDIKMGQCSMLMFEVVRCAALDASALHLLALAFVHYRGIVDPLHYRSTIFFSQHLSRTINVISLCCWIIPLTIMIAWFSSSPCQGFQSDDCDYLFLLGFSFRHMVLAMFALPLLFMSVIYLRIFIIISRHQKGRRQNQERITLSRGVMSATGPIGTTAAAIDLTELIAEQGDEIEEGEGEGAASRCPACLARALMNQEDQSISILSEETIDNVNSSQLASASRDLASATGETGQKQNGLRPLKQKSVSVRGTHMVGHNLNISHAINSGDRSQMVNDSGTKCERDSLGACQEQTTYANNLADGRDTSNDNTSLSLSCDDNNAAIGQTCEADNEIGQSFAMVKNGRSDIHDKQQDGNAANCDKLLGKRDDVKLAEKKRGGDAKRSRFFFLMIGRRRNRIDRPKMKLTPPANESELNLKSRSTLTDNNTGGVKMEQKLNEKVLLPGEARKMEGSPRCSSPNSRSTDDDSSSASSSRSSSNSSFTKPTEAIFKRERQYSLKSASGKREQSMVGVEGEEQKINRINRRPQLRAQFSLGAQSGSGEVEKQQQRREVQLVTLRDKINDGEASKTSGRTQSRARETAAAATTTTKAQVSRQQSNPVSGDSLLTRECTCDNRLQQFDRSRKLSRSNTIGGAHSGASSSALVRNASKRQYLAKLRTKQEQERKAALVALTGVQGSSISSSAVASQQQQQLLLPPLKQQQRTSGPIKQHRFSSLKSNLHKLSASNSATGSRYGQAVNSATGPNTQTFLTNQLRLTTTTRSNTTSNASTYEPQRRHIHASAVPQTNTKALVTTLLILGTYFISYVPAIIYQVLTCVDNCPYPLYTISFRRRIYLGAMTTLLLIAKSIIDPFIYSYRMSEIQVAITRYLSKRRSKTSLATSMYNSQRLNKSFNYAQNYNNTNNNQSIANNSMKHNVNASTVETNPNSSSKILSHHHHHRRHHHQHGSNHTNSANSHHTYQFQQNTLSKHRRILPKQLTNGTTTSSSDPVASQNQTLSTTTTTTATTTTTIVKNESRNDTQQELTDEQSALLSTSTKIEGQISLDAKCQDKEENFVLLDTSNFKCNGRILNDSAETVEAYASQTRLFNI